MNPSYDPDLEPTTTGPVELRYFEVLFGILDQCRQTGLCVAPSHFVATCYAPNVPVALRNDNRVLQQTSTLDVDLGAWCFRNNLGLVITNWPTKTYTFHPL